MAISLPEIWGTRPPSPVDMRYAYMVLSDVFFSLSFLLLPVNLIQPVHDHTWGGGQSIHFCVGEISTAMVLLTVGEEMVLSSG